MPLYSCSHSAGATSFLVAVLKLCHAPLCWKSESKEMRIIVCLVVCGLEAEKMQIYALLLLSLWQNGSCCSLSWLFSKEHE